MRVVGHAAVFVAAYILVMLPTYVLPWVGSNSALLTRVAAGQGKTNWFLILHVTLLVLLAALTWIRGTVIDKRWIVVLPILAGIFDLVPVLNSIPLVPTTLHIVVIVLGVALTPSGAGAASVEPQHSYGPQQPSSG